jgi:flagellin
MAGLSVTAYSGSLNTVRNLSTMQRSVNKTMSKMSSGLAINTAADDPAGLVISEKMRSQIGSIAQQITNLDNLIDKNRTADSYIMKMEEQLIDVREIAVAAASSGSVDDSMAESYNDAVSSSVDTINSQIKNAAYGSKNLLDGSEGSVAKVTELRQFDISKPEQAEQAIEEIDRKLGEVHKIHGELGAKSARELQSMRDSLAVSSSNATASESQIRDGDAAKQQTALVSQMLRLNTGTATLAHGKLLSKSVLGLLS